MSTFKAQMGDDNYEKLRQTFAKLFPGAADKIDDDFLDRIIDAMQQDWHPQYAQLGVPQRSSVDALPAVDMSEVDAKANFPLYLGVATHQRFLQMNSDEPMQSKFDGLLPLVRVPLPSSFNPNNPRDPNLSVKTQIGTVYFSRDHLVGSVDLVAEKYGDPAYLGYRPGRVELITPARQGGARFGAVAMYLIYRNSGDTTPSAYLLEAGMATGQASVLFFGKTMDTVIVQPSWYTPTPFSEVTNYFRGSLTVVDNEPRQMMVDVLTNQNSPNPFVTVTLNFQTLKLLDETKWPALLTLEAAMRVALIAQTMNIPNAVPFQDLLAELGKHLNWLITPQLGSASAPDVAVSSAN